MTTSVHPSSSSSSSSTDAAATPSPSATSSSSFSSPLFTKPAAIQPLDNVLRYLTTQTTPYRSVSLYWYEKILSLFFIIQLAGLLMRAIVWPARWRLTLRWTCLFNADSSRYFAYTDVSTGQGIPDDNPYGVLIAGITWGLLPVFFYYLRYLLLQYSFLMHFSVIQVQQKIDSLYTLLAIIAYTPATLSISCVYALWYKDSIGQSRALPSWDILIIGILCLPSIVYVCVGIPYVLYRYIHTYSFHHTSVEHELYIRRIEAEYMLNINDLWEHDKVWLVSSFRYAGYQTYTLPLWLITLGILAWITALGYDYPEQQSNVFFVLIGLYTARHFVFPTFRCFSSNIVLTIVLLLYCIVTFFGVMKAHEMRSELTVDSSLYNTFYGLHTATVTLLLIIFVIISMFGRGWPRSNSTEEKHESLLYTLLYGRLSHQWYTTWKKKTSNTVHPLLPLNDPSQNETNETIGVNDEDNTKVPDQDNNDDSSSSPTVTMGAQAPSIEQLEQQLEHTRQRFLRAIVQTNEGKRLLVQRHNVHSSAATAAAFTGKASTVQPSSSPWRRYFSISVPSFLRFSSSSAYSPSSATMVQKLVDMEKNWQPILRQAFQALAIERTKPLLMVNLHTLLHHLQLCYTAMNDALVCQHILSLTFAEAIDSLSLLYTLARPLSIVHHPHLTPYLPFLCQRMQNRAVEYALSGPLRSRLILKLLAYRAFIKDKRIPRLYIPKVNDNYFLSATTLAKKHGIITPTITNSFFSNSNNNNDDDNPFLRKRTETDASRDSNTVPDKEIDLFTELLGKMEDD